MIVRHYECDLCRDTLDPNNIDSLFGLVWKHDGLHVTKTILLLEHHLCIKCFQAIRAADFTTQ